MNGQEIEDQKKPKEFKPSQYMRWRRPELYSDSITTIEHTITREVLSHHLETLTNQKDENIFEKFAHRLAKKFISPNLRPQTGPVGGGDGKTDTETYPVSLDIAKRWYVSDLTGAHERWAFAFSAKKDWLAKLKSDVASIVSTKRDYTRIYFITNQYVPAKDSAKAQDNLLEKYGIPITILDRTWLLDRVFEHDSLDIAIETLGVGKGAEHKAKTIGPKDLQRSKELDALEKAIGDGTNYNGTTHALIEDCMRAAKLARGLEKSRHEVEGLYQRAIRIARDNKLHALHLAAVYELAWTSNFWFDDAASLNSLYSEVERLALMSGAADDLQLISNLLPLVRTNTMFGLTTPEFAKIDGRTEALLNATKVARKDTSRPNNALHAHAIELMARITQAKHTDDENLDDLWNEFYDVVKKTDGLGTFPFQPIADALTEVGKFTVESKAFDRLYEAITDALAKRISEGEAAIKNSERGFQKLEKQLPYDAIRWFGRAVSLLIKKEYADELVTALIGSSIAYEEAGLLWASRNYALAAASHEFSAFNRTGSIEEITPSVLSRLFHTELRLGRVPNILSTYELGAMIRNARSTTPEQKEYAEKVRIDQSHMLGALILRTAFLDLPHVEKLADGLERIGLEHARMALLFLLGHEDTLRQEGWVPSEVTPEDFKELFEHWALFGNDMELPDHPSYLLNNEVVLRSRILGCELNITCANNLISVGIGEAILGTLEALLATSLAHNMLPALDVLNIRVNPIDDAPLTPMLNFAEENGVTVGFVTHAPQLNYSTLEEALTFPNWLQEATVHIFARFAPPIEPDKWGESVLDKENGFSRALTFSNIPTMLNIIFGNKERLSIEDWIQDIDANFDVRRQTPWVPKLQPSNEDASDLLKFGKGEIPEELKNPELMKHTDMRVISPIDMHKWDAAHWNGALFMMKPDDARAAPVLALTFVNREPAEGIFQGWRGRFGFEDLNQNLRIAIIRGVTSSNSNAYAIMIGPNVDKLPKIPNSTAVSRFCIMTPSSSKNFDTFLAEYQKHKRYLLAPAHLPSQDAAPELPLVDLALGKYDLIVREAWQIGENDMDISAIDLDDLPIIPHDQDNAPILKAIKWLEKIRKETD